MNGVTAPIGSIHALDSADRLARSGSLRLRMLDVAFRAAP